MKTLSVSRLKAQLSEQLRYVKGGEVIVVTERGRPIARLVPVAAESTSTELAELEAKGVVSRGEAPLPAGFWDDPPAVADDGSLRRALLEERSSGW